jgi:diadenosine tetraphosphate (Ap4A) HIT family hydrolase
MQYDRNNVFYKIIHGELNSNIVLEGEHFVAIPDISPKAPVHILVIPKSEYVDMYDFALNASAEEITEVIKAVPRIVDMMQIREGGFRVVSNAGKFGQQEVLHFHLHIMGKPSE